ncbi:MAG TPA: hypothetical protein VED01_05160 [Burkholderiales bacterium]|nr:hypothetical protein [Burkholderiales bacterium]
MSAIEPTSIISHWSHRSEGLQLSSNDFYTLIEDLIEAQHVEGIHIERVDFSEGGFFSPRREYLQLRRRNDVFHVCAAPFGTGFFVSSWLGKIESDFLAWLFSKPIVGPLTRYVLQPLTYYKIDTALMFQSLIQGAVTQALDQLLKAKGLRTLTETERKPVMRDLFAKFS